MIDPLALSSDAIVELTKLLLQRRRELREAEEELPEWKRLEKAYLEHLEWRFSYPGRVFGQRIVATWILTVLVVGLVICGLVFAFLQLHYALSLGNFASLETAVEVQTAGELSFRSSVIGAMVLVISLLFFHLYLKHVFKIRHPLPPHVSLADTDAQSVWEELREKFGFAPAKGRSGSFNSKEEGSGD